MSTFSLAAKFTASYIAGNNIYDYRQFLVNNPKLSVLRLLYSETGNEALDNNNAHIATIKLVAHIAGMGFEMEAGRTLQSVIESVQDTIMNADNCASDLCAEIDLGWKFPDEL